MLETQAVRIMIYLTLNASILDHRAGRNTRERREGRGGGGCRGGKGGNKDEKKELAVCVCWCLVARVKSQCYAVQCHANFGNSRHAANIISSGKVPAGSRSGHERRVLCRALTFAMESDGLNAASLPCCEFLSRRQMSLETAHRDDPEKP
eukprot:714234-Pyramimonas_sp.AAC.1